MEENEGVREADRVLEGDAVNVDVGVRVEPYEGVCDIDGVFDGVPEGVAVDPNAQTSITETVP